MGLFPSVCKGCGRKILFRRCGEKLIPLDPTPPVYKVVDDEFCERERGVMVSHFATCPAVRAGWKPQAKS